ncbi:MAG TPA: xanthine dehydrogenase family protein molybdopterin-binding subunit [Caldimonas sp.]|nr:xanthine dehydrogenase family protein molybdopterin-binding subunit [Caldimonas sp.]
MSGETGDVTRGHVGRALARFEDERFLRGEGCFVADFERPDLCHAVVVRSTVAAGRVRAIDASAALALPGVLRVLTHADLGKLGDVRPIPIRVGALEGLERFLQRPLAHERVRYVGEPLAVVIADDPYVAEDGADLVFAEIEPEDPVVTIAGALEGTRLAHPEIGTNVAAQHVAARGDVDAAFARAEYIRRERFTCHRHSSVPLETRGLVAEWDAGSGTLRVWGATKAPFFARRTLATLLGLEERQVEQIELDVGGSFGARGEFYPEDLLVPFAAMQVGRPVKWIEDRRENLIAMNHSREMTCELEIAARRDGTILALRGALAADLGAYARTTGGIVPAKAASFLPGPYAIGHVAIDVRAVVTNKTPCGTCRGPGRYEANFFRERLIDLMCADLGLDPADVRLRNLVPPERMPYATGRLVPYEPPGAYDSGDYPAVCREALERIGYAGLSPQRGCLVDGRWHGVGIACFVDSSGGGPPEQARVRASGSGRFRLDSGASSSGQGQQTTYAQILADVLGVEPSAIDVHLGSTTGLSRGVGTFHGRGIVMGGSAVRRAGEAFVAGLLEEAARRSGAPRDTLAFAAGGVVRAADGTVVLSIDALVGARDSGDAAAAALLDVEASHAQSGATFEYGTQVAHVAIDPGTWEVEVVRFLTVEDCGHVVNPLVVHGQVIGASVQGLGGTLLEEFRYDEHGQMTSGTFADYLLPTSTDFPHVEGYSADHAPSPLNPLGAKGVGEGATGGVGGAVANAVADALRSFGVKIVDLPITPDRLFALVQAARGREGTAVPYFALGASSEFV